MPCHIFCQGWGFFFCFFLQKEMPGEIHRGIYCSLDKGREEEHG